MGARLSTIIPQMEMSAYFLGSVDRFAAMGAPLYAALAAGVAEDAELCAMAAQARAGQPPDHLLFAAAELVLTQHPGDPLAAYFPGMTPTAKSPGAAFESFRAFCLAHRAAIEALVYPASSTLFVNNATASAGWLEIAPASAPLTVFVFGPNRIVPVRITELSIVEEAFDTSLNPLRAKISLGLRVLSVDDIGFNSKGGGLFMGYLQAKERLATQAAGSDFRTLGISGVF